MILNGWEQRSHSFETMCDVTYVVYVLGVHHDLKLACFLIHCQILTFWFLTNNFVSSKNIFIMIFI